MKKFFTEATVDQGTILLDGKQLTTPAKNTVILPNAELAQAVANEWNAQGESIDKNALPLTGMASLALDIALPRREELLEELLEYGETDLLFYHSDEAELAKQQHVQWQPWINRAQVAFNTRYETTDNVMPIAQPSENKTKHAAKLEGLDHWKLALLAAVMKPTTSLLLGWFYLENELNDAELFTLSQLEEAHNAAKWGEDAETREKSESVRQDLATATLWRSLL